MQIGLGAMLATPCAELEQCDGVNAFRYPDGIFRVAVQDILDPTCDAVVAIIEQKHLSVLGFNFSPPIPEGCWHSPHASFVGGVLIGDEIQVSSRQTSLIPLCRRRAAVSCHEVPPWSWRSGPLVTW